MVLKSPTLEDLLKQTYEDVEQKIPEIVKDKNILWVLEGGKRLRPVIGSVVFWNALDEADPKVPYQQFLEGMVSIELGHSASLVHDDIMDNDEERRGRPAFWVKEGIGNAILIGHKMIAMAFDISLKTGLRTAHIYTDGWLRALEGQIDEINFNRQDFHDFEVSADSKFFELYSKIIDFKTATLFAGAAEVSAVYANRDNGLAKLFYEYGREVGFAYQLADDIVDLENGEMIDSVIIPLLMHLDEKGKIKEGGLKMRYLRKKLKEKEPEIKELYLKEIHNHLARTVELADSDLVPKNHYQELLKQVPYYVINKMLDEINIKIEPKE